MATNGSRDRGKMAQTRVAVEKIRRRVPVSAQLLQELAKQIKPTRKVWGRKSTLEKIEEAKQLLIAGETWNRAAKSIGVTRQTLDRHDTLAQRKKWTSTHSQKS